MNCRFKLSPALMINSIGFGVGVARKILRNPEIGDPSASSREISKCNNRFHSIHVLSLDNVDTLTLSCSLSNRWIKYFTQDPKQQLRLLLTAIQIYLVFYYYVVKPDLQTVLKMINCRIKFQNFGQLLITKYKIQQVFYILKLQ